MMKKILWIAVALPLWLSAANNDLDSLKGLILTKAKFPVYNEQNLQSMIFTDKAERQGKIIVGSDTVMDLIDNTVSVDDIKDGWGTKVYDLDAKLPALVDFWGKRSYSRGVIVSRSVNIDQESRSANGKEPVFFRSPVMDLDGIGFESDFDKNTLLIKEDVSIVIRLGASDIKSVIANKKLPAKYEFATASSDSLLIDMKNNTITLIDNVVINEEKSVINCDKLTIYLNNTNGLMPKNNSFQGHDLAGVNRIVCDGKVYLKRTGKDRNDSRLQATAEKLVYDLESDLITLSGENKPKITTASGTLSGRIITIDRNNEEIKIVDGAEISSPNLRPPQNSNAPAISVNDVQIAKIRQLFADQDSIVRCSAPADDKKTDGKKPEDKRTDDAEQNNSSITSNSSDFNYKGGKLVFEGNVKVRDQQLNLDCERLEIYLEDKPGEVKKEEPKAKSEDPLAMTEVSSEKKQVKKIVCIGKVRAVDSSMDLAADKLTLDFDQNAKTSAAAGTLAPGMFQSGNSNVSRATAEGNLVIKSTDDGKKGKKTGANPMGNLLQGGSGTTRTLKSDNGFLDFVKNEAEFHGKVNILDDQGNLKCEDMYIYTAKAADKKPKGAKNEDIDADPFAAKKDGESNQNAAPETIVLADGVELSKIICKNNVEISRKTSKNELQQAFGQQAEYHVGNKKIIMTGTKEKQPWMKVEQGRMFGDRIIVLMETEEMKVDGNTRVELNRGLSF